MRWDAMLIHFRRLNSSRMFRALCPVIALALALPAARAAEPLVLDGTIPLADTSGRIDHMSFDLVRKHQFVAELGNGTVDVVDVQSRKVVHRISGLDEPQGVVYAPAADVLAVASGGDGTVRFYAGDTFTPRGALKLGDDADNARLDPTTGDMVIGYGSGALAIIDPAKAVKLGEIRLPAHPEAFQISEHRVFINMPDAGQVGIADLPSNKLIDSWTPKGLSSNFPMALDDHGDVAIDFRAQSRLVVFNPRGGVVAVAGSCSDSDDVFFDTKRKRFYVSCGAGFVDVVGRDPAGLHLVARTRTSWGARTSLFVPELDRLYVGARAGLLGSNASIQVFRPLP
jgi:DNA-binding beta-propeller fold protein YncE